MPTKNVKRKTKRKPAAVKAGGSRTVEDRAQASAQAVNRDMAVITKEFIFFCDKVGISRSVVARILGVSHTTMRLVERDVEILSPLRKRAAVMNFRAWARGIKQIDSKLSRIR